MRIRLVLTGFLILAVAGLCFGQTTRTPPPGAKTKVQAQKTIAAGEAMNTFGKMPLIKTDDGLQCLLKHTSEMTAAYTEAANSGCTRVEAGQGTTYNCGEGHTEKFTLCEAAAAKLGAILKNCGLKPPKFEDKGIVQTGYPQKNIAGVGVNAAAGCNSLGITCFFLSPPPR